MLKNYYQKGVTVIEMLLAIAILGILGAGFLGLQYVISQNQTVAWQNYLSIEEANTTMSSIVRELRNARPSAGGSYPLVILNDNEIIFYADFDFDEVVERIRYTRTGTVLVRGIIKPTGSNSIYSPTNERVKTLSSNVKNGSDPIFYYFNSAWPGDTVNNPLSLGSRLADTKMVKIVLKLNPGDNQTKDFVLRSDAKIRMLN